MITINRTLLQQDGTPDAALLTKLLGIHGETCRKLEALRDVYNRKHRIGRRARLSGLPNNRLAHDLPGYIVTMAAGYLVGNPVQYAPQEAGESVFEPIAEALKAANADSVDAELAVDAAVYGKGVEICYADEQSRPRMAQLSPLSAFVVYDDTVEHQPLFGVTLAEMLDKTLRPAGTAITLYTANQAIHYERKGEAVPREVGREPHFFGGVPLTEYWNNSREEGDFEPVLDLIDAYDALQSDRVNDKQQFTDSILALYGIGALGMEDTEEYGPMNEDLAGEEGEDGEAVEEVPPVQKASLTPSQRLRQTKTLFMPGDGAKAEWLTKPLSESDTEVLRQSLKDDIHKLSMVPDLTDENFAGNVSGVAMRFKLLGLEQLTKIKERWFREGLRSRLRLLAGFLLRRGAAAVDVDAVQITFKRSLPVNEVEIAQMVQAYDGIVPRQLLLGQVPFVDAPGEAMEMLKAEKEEAEERRERLFTAHPFREEKEQTVGADDE